ncbi:hypothetical protein AVEN_215448-1 [Araneus ventricosus]|uniref:EGF-like domain-containing protein n=1 Tax=Araneus ventricosus TaxID=182803 RepID=A0A4Y1ZKT1_ARAVE|nr:hypothetical protein AVEN_67466-1 [Araneus ventricosus]GBL54460.1 hypothetical protein AVEN_176824-1 [Araneus ventricosus]GBL54480.1 hypothetical protein AVEN_215448-1 [Araneus ventricosus]
MFVKSFLCLFQVCSNLNSCYCDRGWTSYDCSQRADERAHPEGFGPIPNLFTTPEAPSTAAVADWKNKTIRSSFVGKLSFPPSYSIMSISVRLTRLP